jgi:hypothetical protein
MLSVLEDITLLTAVFAIFTFFTFVMGEAFCSLFAMLEENTRTAITAC